MKTLLIMAFALLTGLGTAAAKDIKTLIVTTVPQMHCQNCEKKIKENLRFEKGVKSIETNVEAQTVTIRFDADKTTPEKIIKGFEKFGYKARELKEGEKVKANADEPCTNM